MEAYGGTTLQHDDDGSDDQFAGRRKVRSVNAMPEDVRVKRLEETVAAQSREIQQLRVNAEKQRSDMTQATVVSVSRPNVDPPPSALSHPSGPPAPRPADNPTHGSWSNGEVYYNGQQPHPLPSEVTPPGRHQQSRRGRGGRVPNDTCRHCLLPGHWQRECPQRNNQPSAPPMGTGRGTVGGVSGLGPHSETYMDVKAQGCIIPCQIDSGCDYSVIPRRLIPNAVLTPSTMQLTAANSTPISVLGMYRLHFTVQNIQLYADLIVSDTIDEFLLGYNWLKQWNCQWDFSKSLLTINGLVVKLKSRPVRNAVHRVYVRETIDIPIDTHVNVPV